MINVNPTKRGKYRNAKVGAYKPQNPQKYTGQYPIIYKSQLEFLAMRYLDTNPAIIAWGYENINIKYFDKTRNKVRRYFLDFVAVAQIGSLKKTIWLEIKPHSETIAPKNKKDFKGLQTYLTNMCKWEAATQIAKSKGAEFHVLTEEQLK